MRVIAHLAATVLDRRFVQGSAHAATFWLRRARERDLLRSRQLLSAAHDVP
jgi:hypothetical protein